MTMGDRIKALREGLGLSQKELADAVGKTQQAVDAWERNIAKPQSATLEKVATALHATPNDLHDTPSNNNQNNSDRTLKVIFEQKLPKTMKVLGRDGKKITPEMDSIIAKIIATAEEDKD